MKTALFAAIFLCTSSIASPQSEKSESTQVHIYVSDVSSHDVAVSTAHGSSGGTASISPSGGSAQTWGSYSAYASSGNYPQMPEIARAFVTTCPGVVVVTTESDKADYLLIVNHERFQELEKHNKVILVSRTGDVIWGDSTRKLDNAIKDACQFLTARHGGPLSSAKTAYIDNQSADSKTAARASNELRKWGKFQETNDRDNADLVFLFSGTKDHQHLAVIDAKTGAALWDSPKVSPGPGQNETSMLIDRYRKEVDSAEKHK